MFDLSDVSDLREFFQSVKDRDGYVHIRFHGLDKNAIEGNVARVAHDFVELRHRYAQYICPYNAIRLVVLKE